MNSNLIYKISGIISIAFGSIAALCVLDIKLTFPGLLFSIMGFIFSSINIFLNAKHEFSAGKFFCWIHWNDFKFCSGCFFNGYNIQA